MLNRTIIMDIARKNIINREISEAGIITLFDGLDDNEIDEIKVILESEGISCVKETTSEKKAMDSSETLRYYSFGTDASQLKGMSNEQLCVLAQRGNQDAKYALVEKNKRYIYKIALSKRRQFIKSSYEVEDIFQEGVIGMLTAVDKFDVSLGYKFLTYAGYWITQNIDRQAIDNGFEIRLPVHMFERVMKVNKIRLLNPMFTHDELLNEISRCIGCERAHAAELIAYANMYGNTASLNSPVGDDDSDELQNFIPDESVKSVEDEIFEKDLRDSIDAVLDTLKPREKKVLEMRFGLIDGSTRTLEEVGREFNVTRERIRQIEAKALRRLRHPSRSRSLKVYAAA